MRNPEKSQHLLRGQLVEVRSSSEIAATLDVDGKLDGVPFMPEMVKYCGSRIRVSRRADKTCVAGQGHRRMKSTVFLQDLRCDGAFHGGCQRNCLFFWKEAWLRPVSEDAQPSPAEAVLDSTAASWSEQYPTRCDDRYFCQSTELYAATTALSRWDITPFVREVFHGELSPRDLLKIIMRTVLHRFFRWGESENLVGSKGKKSKGDLNLQAGEWVDVKKTEKIKEFLDPLGSNCGLFFKPTMSEAIGGRYQVEFPVQKIIVEQTGKMVQLSNTVALKGVICEGVCVNNCPRSEYLYWRESWLQRAEKTVDAEQSVANVSSSKSGELQAASCITRDGDAASIRPSC